MRLLLPFLSAAFASDCVLTRTRSGRECQRWDSNSPHRVKFFPNPRNHNHCANPDNDPRGNWCYTSDPGKRYEYCGKCETPNTTKRPTTPPAVRECNTTKSGYTCQRWDAFSPHYPKYKPDPKNHNYCRSPDNDPKPWCYTTDPNKRWEHCDENCGTGGADPTEAPNTTRRTTTRPAKAECGLPVYEPTWEPGLAQPSLLSPDGDGGLDSDAGALDIYGGDKANPKNLPWQVLLRGPAGCGGTLVSLTTVITAMHCVVGTRARQWKVSAGHVKKYTRDAQREPGWQIRQVKNLVQHPKYNSYSNDNDIAIFVMDTPFEYTDWVRPACLPNANFKTSGFNLIISGWGETENGPTRDLLMNVIPMHNMNHCQANLYNRLSEHMICGGQQGEDTCQGDSGGPLIAMIDNYEEYPKYTLVGVTSWGYGCGKQGKPGVYAEVADYLPWIQRYL